MTPWGASTANVAPARLASPRPSTLLYPHGFGDVIQALPAFRAYAAEIGEPLRIGVLGRLPACREVLERRPFVREVFPLQDPWNDFEPANTWTGFQNARAAILARHIGALWVATTPPADPCDAALSKALRVAAELGVTVPASIAPEVREHLDPAEYHRGQAYSWKRIEAGSRLAYVHGSSGQPGKDLRTDTLAHLARCSFTRETSPHGDVTDRRPTRVEILPVLRSDGTPESVAFHLGALDEADLFVGIDSGPAHLASLSRTHVAWVFTSTPVAQAVPMHRKVLVYTSGPLRADLSLAYEAWCRRNPAFAPGHTLIATEVW